jgi:hypothetical protein
MSPCPPGGCCRSARRADAVRPVDLMASEIARTGLDHIQEHEAPTIDRLCREFARVALAAARAALPRSHSSMSFNSDRIVRRSLWMHGPRGKMSEPEVHTEPSQREQAARSDEIGGGQSREARSRAQEHDKVGIRLVTGNAIGIHDQEFAA